MRAFLAAWAPALGGLVLPLAEGAVTPCTGDLAAYRWTQRPLVAFAPDWADPRHRVFTERARLLAPDLADRDIALIHALARTTERDPPCTVDLDAAARLRAALGVAPQDATVVLFGKDGTEKRRQSIDAPLEPLLELIDGMPMRQREVKSRDTLPP